MNQGGVCQGVRGGAAEAEGAWQEAQAHAYSALCRH